MKKATISRILCVLLACILVFCATACSSNTPSTDTPANDTPATDTPATDTPATDTPANSEDEPAAEPRVITSIGKDLTNTSRPWWTLDAAWDYEAGQAFSAKLKEMNIDLQYETVPNEQYDDTVKNRMAADLDIPDLVCVPGTQADWQKYYATGNYWNISELLETYDEDGSIMAYLNEHAPTSLYTILDDNGDLLWLPSISHTMNCTGSALVFSLRTDWMENLGLEYKNFYTPDELYDVLVALYENDANGNGVKDEVIGFDPSSDWEPLSAGFGMGTNYIYALNDGKGVHAKVDAEGFPDFIRFCQKLYQAGVFSTEILNSDNGIISGNRASAIYDFDAQTWVENGIAGYEDTAEYAGIVIDDDAGVNGYTMAYRGNLDSVAMAWMVRKDAKNPDAIVDLLDYLYSYQGFLDLYLGVEGLGYEWDSELNIPIWLVNTGANPLTEENAHEFGLSGTIMNNLFPNNYVNNYGSVDRSIEVNAHPQYKYKDSIQTVFKDALGRVGKDVAWLPGTQPLAMATDAENEVINAKWTQVKTYTQELILDLIIGNKSLDDLPTYRAELTDLGLDELLDVYQARYDRYMAALQS